MKTQMTRAAHAKAAPRPIHIPHFLQHAARPFRDEEVYPGITRAQLREDIIDQIG